MKRHSALPLLAVIGLLAFSCAGKSPSAAHTAPPEITGAVRLVLVDSLGITGRLAPRGISFGPDGALYVCDRESRSILRLKPGDNEVARFGGFDSRAESRFSPEDVDASGGVDVFVLDEANSRVFRLDRGLRNGSVVLGGISGGRFGTFRGLAYDRDAGDILVTNGADGTVERLDLLSGITRALGGFGDEHRSLIRPAGLATTSAGTIFVADEGRGAVAVLSRSGGEVRFIGAAALESPRDVAVLPGGLLAAADRRGVVILSRNGVAEGFAGFGAGREMQPVSVAWRDGRLYVADSRSGAILVYSMERTK